MSWTGAEGFGFDASLTWSDFTFGDFIDNNGNDFSGSRLPGLPEYFGYLGLRYETENGFTAAFDTNYSGSLFANNANSVKVPSYTVSSLRATYEFQNGDWLFRPYIGINNLFDETTQTYMNTGIRGYAQEFPGQTRDLTNRNEGRPRTIWLTMRKGFGS